MATSTVTRTFTLQCSSPRTRDTHTCCRAFGNEDDLHEAVLMTEVCADRGSNPDLPHARRTLYLFATAALSCSHIAKRLQVVMNVLNNVYTVKIILNKGYLKTTESNESHKEINYV